MQYIMVHQGTDAGGYIIKPDGKGGVIIQKIPGWNPDALRNLKAALNVVSASVALHADRSGPELLNASAKVAGEHLGAFLEHAGEGVGAGTVIVMA